MNELPLRPLAERAGRSTTAPAVVGRFYWVNKMPYITVETEVDIDLEDIDADDLIEALAYKGRCDALDEKQMAQLLALANGVTEELYERDPVDALHLAIIKNDPSALHKAASDLIYSVKGRIC